MLPAPLWDMFLRLKAIRVRHHIRATDHSLWVANLELRRIEKLLLAARGACKGINEMLDSSHRQSMDELELRRIEKSMLAARGAWNELNQRLDFWRQRLENLE